MKIVQALEDCDTLLKGVTKTIKYEAKEQKNNFQECYEVLQEQVFLETYQQERELQVALEIKKGKGIVTAGYGKEWDF